MVHGTPIRIAQLRWDFSAAIVGWGIDQLEKMVVCDSQRHALRHT